MVSCCATQRASLGYACCGCSFALHITPFLLQDHKCRRHCVAVVCFFFPVITTLCSIVPSLCKKCLRDRCSKLKLEVQLAAGEQVEITYIIIQKNNSNVVHQQPPVARDLATALSFRNWHHEVKYSHVRAVVKNVGTEMRNRMLWSCKTATSK